MNGVSQTLDNFWKDHTCSDGHSGICTTCRKIQHLNYGPKRRELILLKKYGLTVEQYEQMLKDQNYGCANCGSKNPKNKSSINTFNVDHCHKTGKVRGLLCSDCNAGLGKLGDDISSIERILAYLKRTQ